MDQQTEAGATERCNATLNSDTRCLKVIDTFRSGYRMKHVVAITAGIWVLNVAVVFFAFNTYLPEVRLSLLDAVTLLLIVAFTVAIPSAPAGLGLFEAGIVAYLTQKFGVGSEAALAAAAVFHLVVTFPQLTMTGWLLWNRRGLAIVRA